MGITQKLKEFIEGKREERASDILIRDAVKGNYSKNDRYNDPTMPSVERLSSLVASIERSYRNVGSWHFGQPEWYGEEYFMSKVEAEECVRVLRAKGYDIRKVWTIGGYRVN